MKMSIIQMFGNKACIVDLDTGTVLGTNCVLLNPAMLDDDMSDGEVTEYANLHGIGLFVIADSAQKLGL